MEDRCSFFGEMSLVHVPYAFFFPIFGFDGLWRVSCMPFLCYTKMMSWRSGSLSLKKRKVH